MTMFAVTVLALVVWIGVLVIQLFVAFDDRAGLSAAADAAVLAAVGAAVEGVDPVSAAHRVAVVNGGRLLVCRCPRFEGATFRAVVKVGGMTVLPLIGSRSISVTATAEYSVDG